MNNSKNIVQYLRTIENKKPVLQMNLPYISIIIVTKNSQRTLQEVFDRIAQQEYPKKNIEILIVDGNSTDKTHAIIKKAATFLPIRMVKSEFPNDPEACRGVGILAAQHEILGFIDSDNYIPYSSWLKDMMEPFLKHKEIYGVQTLRYEYRKKDSALNRYFALLGSCDPVGFYLKKDDRLSYLYDKWNLYGKIISDHKKYFLVKFDPRYFPTLGCNGFFFRKNMLMKLTVTPQNFFHIDTPLDLAKKGINTYAIIRNGIIHDTAGSFWSFLKKRALYMRLHYQIRSNKRRYKVFDPSRRDDKTNLIKFSFYALTFVQPFYLAIKGFVKKRDYVWFVHPVFCFAIFWVYTFMVLLAYVQGKYFRYAQPMLRKL